MKKIILLIISSLMIFGLLVCSDEEEEIEGAESPEELIANLEEAINNHSFSNFMICFDDSTSLQASYTEGQFDIQFPSTTDYTFGALTIVGNNITCTSMKNAAGSYFNEFAITENDEHWYIITWDEDSTPVFWKK